MKNNKWRTIQKNNKHTIGKTMKTTKTIRYNIVATITNNI